ncbi:LysR family transcriptional regulator [Vibrio tubiashii]|uniref:LysR family transcriptional regulator n=1 Tax=Vibrio tubiashii TaxID=29498 RepID=UPI00234FB203|nr:LysR family transcriptional regulator [Vibrio tubiashii]WCP69542.1 LysR family transcriptional regulator [Vibrio tubiashii]
MRHLKSFHVFHVAAQCSNYSEAAEQLNITHGAVSKQIKVLENYLDQTLFVKQGRNVRLSQQGELLKTYTEQAFQALETGVAKLETHNQNVLEVSCEPTLTMRWLMPRLSTFNDDFATDVRLSTAGGAINLERSGLSMAIRRDDFAIPHDYQQTPLIEEWVGPVMSPEYWQQVEQDLTTMKLLHSHTRPLAWENWCNELNKPELLANEQQTFAHFYFSLQASVDGLGATIGSYPLVADDLQRGNLIAPFGFVPSGHSYTLLSKNQPATKLEDQFRLWLLESFKDCEPEIAQQLINI